MQVQKYALQSPCSGGRLWLGVFETPFLVDRGMGFFSDFFLSLVFGISLHNAILQTEISNLA
jgi:hypothetical protein